MFFIFQRKDMTVLPTEVNRPPPTDIVSLTT
jgi:hypothetical protein